MNETEETIQILDWLRKRVKLYPLDMYAITWNIDINSGPPYVFIGLSPGRNSKFVAGDFWNMGEFDGFELLEYLAERYPSIAARLAEPMNLVAYL